MPQERPVRARVFVSGDVQGVCFRAYAAEAGRDLGVYGWVRNRADGRVELLIEGAREKVDAMIDWCGRGSPYARVDDIEVRWEDQVEGLSDFRIVR